MDIEWQPCFEYPQHILKDFKTHHLLKCKFMSKIGYFHYVKNEIDKFRHLACIQ